MADSGQWKYAVLEKELQGYRGCGWAGPSANGPFNKVPTHLENKENSWNFMLHLEFLVL